MQTDRRTQAKANLIILDIYENTTYDIQNELKVKFPDLDLVVLIGSVRNTNRMNWIFETYHPEIIYHAATHKHVPLMERARMKQSRTMSLAHGKSCRRQTVIM